MYNNRTKNLSPDVSCLLFGPRGTGKTFWLRHTFPRAIYIDLLEARTATVLLADPQRLSERLPADGAELVIIDEIQRVPDLLNEVQRIARSMEDSPVNGTSSPVFRPMSDS